MWIARAERADGVIREAAAKALPVRVIVNDGDLKGPDDPLARASKVKTRLLDAVAWGVASYDPESGDSVIERGLMAPAVTDQFDQEQASEDQSQRVEIHGTAFVRNRNLREAALRRARGRCEYCNAPGFMTNDNQVFLETHHIVPLGEGGPDVLENIAAVCANHHREAHWGAAARHIRAYLLEKVAKSVKVSSPHDSST